MSDLKSKLPDLKELGEITGKLFKDMKTSVGEIMHTYREKRAEAAAQAEKEAATTPVTKKKADDTVSKTPEVSETNEVDAVKKEDEQGS